ncbi:MAG: flavodoxin [Lachnospiraceae bacterium]|nr:flavodoxin [Acetatifactor muris]MCM1218578.1 flavodoxin [Lachnospiraceae bacterium]
MKKVFAVMISFVLLSAMTACGSSNGNTDNHQASGSQPETVSGEAETPAADSKEEPDETEMSAAADSSAETQSDENGSEQAEGSNILIAYFSRVGNMEFDAGVDAVASASVNLEDDDVSGNAGLLAQMAQEVTGGDLFFIETVEKYPAAYRGTTDQAKEEQNDDARPELASHVEDMDAYDTIILIYPNWWGTLPQPVFTFLEEYDFSGKTIWPLCTHEGSRLGSSESDIARLAPDAELAEGLAIRGSDVSSSQADVEAWLNGLKVSE